MAVRLGRSEEYGHLVCGACAESVRDKMRCVLPGHEREPAPAPTYRVDMGPASRAALFTRCPVGLALTDDAARYLSAYGLVKRWGKWPPGRDNPALLEAMSLIEREHDLITLERAPAHP